MRSRYLTILFIAIKIFPGFGQNHSIDTLRNSLKTEKEDTNKVKELNKLSEYFWRLNKNDSAMYLAKNAEVLAEKLNFKRGKADAFSNIGSVYREQGNELISREYLLKSLALDQEIKNKTGITKNYNLIGLTYMVQSDYPKSLQYFFKALAMNQEAGDKYDIGINFCNIGNTYFSEGNYSEALDYDFKSLAIEQELGNKRIIAININNIANNYSKLGKYSLALEYSFKSLAIDQELGDRYGVAGSLYNIGSYYFSEGNNSQALEYDSKALVLFKEIQHKDDVAPTFLSIGYIYSRQKNYIKAKEYFDSAMSISKNNGYKETLREIYIRMAEVDSALGNYKAEVEDYKKFVLYSDSIVNENNTKKITQTEMNFEFQKKTDSTTAVQDKLNLIAEKKSQQQKILLYSFMAGFALMIALAFFIFRGYRQKLKANLLIIQQKEEVEKQKTLVEEKNKDITDSINYAKRIQRALLKEEDHVSKHLPEHFILFKPKDIVSGDFYWAVEKEEYFYFAAVDCTGHGVPGGFMSMLGLAFLNELTKGPAIQTPAEILDELRTKILKELKQTGGENETKDGMDISLMRMNLKTNEVQWSGANNPLYVIDNELKETPADKQPIGYYPSMKPFSNHIIKAEKGSILYLLTDGYADQFGGPNGKKFKYAQLKEVLLSIHKKDMKEQKNILNEIFENWKGKLEQVDDILVIGLRV